MTAPRVRPSNTGRQAARAARAMGWFSIGLGLAELLWPQRVSRASGLPALGPLVRAYGLREFVNGVGLLTARDPAPWMWARVAGDALDLATVGGLRRREEALRNGVALAALAGVALADVACAQALSVDKQRLQRPVVDYSKRSGLPLPAEEMRGAALEDFHMPTEFATPEALRPYVSGGRASMGSAATIGASG